MLFKVRKVKLNLKLYFKPNAIEHLLVLCFEWFLTWIKNLSDLVPVLPGLVTKGCRMILRGTVVQGLTRAVWGTTLNLWGAVVLTLIRMDMFTTFLTKIVALVSLVEYPSNTRVAGGEHLNSCPGDISKDMNIKNPKLIELYSLLRIVYSTP